MNSKDQQTKSGKLLLLCLVGVLWLGGCSWYPTSALEVDYGNAVRNNLAQSIVNPRAGLNPTPPVGLDPNAGVNALDSYDKSFKSEAKKPTQMQITY